MDQPTKQLDPFSIILMEQRNGALNEAAYWKAEASVLQSRLTTLTAQQAKPKKPAKVPSGS